MQASPRLGARSCTGTGTGTLLLLRTPREAGGVEQGELCVNSQDISQPAPLQGPFKAFPILLALSNKRSFFGSQRKMFSNDSWLSDLGSTLLQGCWFKCNYKTILNAAEKIWVDFSARARHFFFFTCTNRIFHADPFPLLVPRGECFCPEGSKSCFFPCVG